MLQFKHEKSTNVIIHGAISKKKKNNNYQDQDRYWSKWKTQT